MRKCTALGSSAAACALASFQTGILIQSPPSPDMPPVYNMVRNIILCISKVELGMIITKLDKKCPTSLTKNSAEDKVEINVDHISPAIVHNAMAYVKS
eukprot:3313678-Ditylum_brightwellii.AAC.1